MSENDVPVANANRDTTQEDTPVNIAVITNDDFGGDNPSANAISLTTNANNGTATINDGGTPTDPTDDTIDYQPNTDFHGIDSLVYEICDFDGDCDTALVVIIIESVNDVPVATNSNHGVGEDMMTVLDVTTYNNFGGDNPSVNPIFLITNPVNGTAIINDNDTPNDPTDDRIDYQPNAEYNGLDSLVYEICDFDGDCDTALVLIIVSEMDDFPTAYPDTTILQEDGSSIIIATANDDFGGDGPATNPIDIITNGNNGIATVDDNGTPNDPTDDFIHYIPNPDYNGLDTIVSVSYTHLTLPTICSV